MNEYSIDRFATDAYRILKQFNKSASTSTAYSPAIINLGIGAGKFLESSNTKSIVDLFSRQPVKTDASSSIESPTTWPEHDEEISDDEDTILEKATPVKPALAQGEFFQKFQKNAEPTKSLPSSATNSASAITSFFSRYSSHESTSSVSASPAKSDDRYVTCPKCNKAILAWETAEHDDFHFARELQLEENRNRPAASTSSTVVAPSIVKASKSTKRKNETPQTSSNQTLDAFLNKKSKV